MIHTYSLLQGYTGAIGLLPIRIGMVLTMLFVLPIPVEELKYFNLSSMETLWGLQLGVHVAAGVISVLYLFLQGCSVKIEFLVKVLSTVTTLPLIFTYMW